VWVCPFCDGWEIRDRSIAVYSKDRSGVDLAQELIGWTPHIDVCVASSSDVTERDRRWFKAAGVRLHEGRLDRISGTREHVRAIHLDRGQTIDCDALFLAVPLRQASSLAIALGCDVGENGALRVDSTSQTSVKGVYAAGDAVAPVHQVIFAAASGAQAAMSLTLDLLESDVTALVGKP
nr:FAD-dependent oxidoreductase [Candidatus Eremiobacteraeota bacterium]